MLSEWNHRTGSTKECPHCGVVLNPNEWLTTIISRTDEGETNYSGEVKYRVASPCPRCGKISWCHFTDETLNIYSSHPKIALTIF
jgi:predicted RNA-binding Zn-ribbon protein involved in translation (DUF1610 family)